MLAVLFPVPALFGTTPLVDSAQQIADGPIYIQADAGLVQDCTKQRVPTPWVSDRHRQFQGFRLIQACSGA